MLRIRWLAASGRLGAECRMVLAAAMLFCAVNPAQSQDRPARRRDRGLSSGGDSVPADAVKKIDELEKQAKQLGPWEQEAQFIHQAHLNVFQRNGWNSESDQFALNLLQQVTNISPWEPQRREEAFLNGIQTRLSLTPEQRQLVSDEMKQESLAIGMKHFRTMFPVVMEIAQTRIQQKPFTPEQVQKWSQHLRPVMDDALASLQRSSRKLEASMTDTQRQRFKADMDAVLRRHHDLEKMVERWQTGQWNPTDWGLDNDPVHAGEMAAYRAKVAARDALVKKAEAQSNQPPSIDTADESAWRKYVRWFVVYYKCDDKQTGQAESILKSCEKEATDYLGSRGKEIERLQNSLSTVEGDARRAQQEFELKRLRQPVAEMFARMKRRLETQVLTSDQQKRIPREPPAEPKTAQAKP